MSAEVLANGSRGVRRFKDALRASGTWLSGLFALGMLLWIVLYVFITGSRYLSWDFITGDYYAKNETYRTPESFVLRNYNGGKPFEETYQGTDSCFSKVYGASFAYGKDLKQNEVLYLVHLEKGSPFYDFVDVDGKAFSSSLGSLYLESFIGKTEEGQYLSVSASEGGEAVVNALDRSASIHDLTLSTLGGGIRGSLLTTLSLVGLTLVFALPLGIGAAIYLALYAKDGAFANALRTLIDVTSGVPSIIFGLAGALIFIPFASALNGSSGGSLLSGALTMAVMLLPTIVKTTEESLKALPKEYLQSSLALGASKTQTVFKLLLPSAFPGILTGSLLAIGRIIGESAALVFAMGAVIGESASWTSGYSTLAVHIWNILSGESPAYGQAAAIAIIIFLVVLALNLLVKLIAYRYEKSKGGRR